MFKRMTLIQYTNQEIYSFRQIFIQFSPIDSEKSTESTFQVSTQVTNILNSIDHKNY